MIERSYENPSPSFEDRFLPFPYVQLFWLNLYTKTPLTTEMQRFLAVPDAGMAYVLGALDSRNGGEKKCIGRWHREFGSFKKYKMFCNLIAIIGCYYFVLTHLAV